MSFCTYCIPNKEVVFFSIICPKVGIPDPAITVTSTPFVLDNELSKDAKSRLQELSQELNAVTPIYKVISESGPDHAKNFNIGVYLDNDKLFAEGLGSSKQEAEQDAAQKALEKWSN